MYPLVFTVLQLQDEGDLLFSQILEQKSSVTREDLITAQRYQKYSQTNLGETDADIAAVL
jgi:hypothetical protein